MKKILSRAYRIGVKPSLFERIIHRLSGRCFPCNLIGHFMFLDEVEYSFYESDDQKFYKVTVHYIFTGQTHDYLFDDYLSAEKCFVTYVKHDLSTI